MRLNVGWIAGITDCELCPPHDSVMRLLSSQDGHPDIFGFFTVLVWGPGVLSLVWMADHCICADDTVFQK